MMIPATKRLIQSTRNSYQIIVAQTIHRLSWINCKNQIVSQTFRFHIKHSFTDPSIATTPKSDLKIDFDKAKMPDTSTTSANYIKANSIKPNIIKHKVHETLTTTTTVGLDKKPTLTTVCQSVYKTDFENITSDISVVNWITKQYWICCHCRPPRGSQTPLEQCGELDQSETDNSSKHYHSDDGGAC